MANGRLYFAAMAAILLVGGPVRAQETGTLLERAGSLCRNYDFASASRLLEDARSAADSSLNSAIEALLADARNGENMAGFCSDPVPVARKRVSIKDFYLYFPLEDKSWREAPNAFDPSGGPAVYFPEGARRLFFSAENPQGDRDIYETRSMDTVWTAPALPGPAFQSSGNEIFPMLSPDGRSLYFASDGLYGAGGYDLYVSRLDEREGGWTSPENLGFPYSSPGNDYMFMNTPDGRYSVFASDRDCPPDSVWIYVVEYDAMPVRSSITDPSRLRSLAALEPRSISGQVGEQDPQTARYLEAYDTVETLKDKIEKEGSYNSSLQAELSAAKSRLGDIEMELLMAGKSVEPEKLRSTERSSAAGYEFTKRSYGPAPDLRILSPEPVFDYTLRILEEGAFAEENTIPDGLVYQIQMISLSKQATIQQLKGVSPVFYRKGTNGYIVHYAGLFRTYADAQEGLALVKKAGFPKAFIKAFEDGKEITVAKAREKERQDATLYQIRIVPADGRSLSDKEKAAVSAVSDKDIARVSSDGANAFLLGPFDSRREAEIALTGLKAAGVESASLEEIK